MLCDARGTQDALCATKRWRWPTKAKRIRFDGQDESVCASIPACHDPQTALRVTDAPQLETGN
jgi:hypothetical protein